MVAGSGSTYVEIVGVNSARDDGSLAWVGGSVSGKKCSYSGYNLKVEPAGFAKPLDIGCETKKPKKCHGFYHEQLGEQWYNLLQIGVGKCDM